MLTTLGTSSSNQQPIFTFVNRADKGFTWYKVFKNGPSEICGRQPLKFEVVWSA